MNTLGTPTLYHMFSYTFDKLCLHQLPYTASYNIAQYPTARSEIRNSLIFKCWYNHEHGNCAPLDSHYFFAYPQDDDL